ncbi:GNAT family N-acetyltransferase [Vibrio sp.]|nr:GNAT family N-acetyltransferase [Vibrio sp.]
MLITENLILKPVCGDDYDIYTKILSSDTLTKYLPKGKAYTNEEIERHIQNRIKHWDLGFGSYVIYLRSEPKVKIGYIGVEQCDNPLYSDIRYALLTNYQGFGFIYESAKKVLVETFNANKHLTIYGAAFRDNIPSLNILKKLGMEKDIGVKLYGDTVGLETYSIKRFV